MAITIITFQHKRRWFAVN